MPTALEQSTAETKISPSAEFCADYITLSHQNAELIATELGWQAEYPQSDSAALNYLSRLKPADMPKAIKLVKSFKGSEQYETWMDDEIAGNSMNPEVARLANDLAVSTLVGGLSELYLDKLKPFLDKHRHNLKNNGDFRHLKDEEIARKKDCIRSNGDIRDAVNDFGLDADQLQDLLSSAYLGDRQALTAGLGMELAVKNGLSSLAEKKEDFQNDEIRFGSAEEDSRGGDIVAEINGKTVFVDVKSSIPEKYRNIVESTGHGYVIKVAKDAAQKNELGCDISLTVWPKDKERSYTDNFVPRGDFGFKLEHVWGKVHEIASQNID